MDNAVHPANILMSIMLAILVVAVFGALGAYDNPQPSAEEIVRVCEYTRDAMGNTLSSRCWEEVR